MAKIVKITICEKKVYAEFDGYEPELGVFKATHGSVERIAKLLKVYGADKVFFGISADNIKNGVSRLKSICLKAGYNLRGDDVEYIYRAPEGNGLYRCTNGDCHRIFMVSNFELNRMMIKNWTSKICPCCGKRTRVIPSF